MAGFIYAFLRLLRLRPAFDATMASPEYPGYKVDGRITKVLKNDTCWNITQLVVKASFGPLHLLRIADKKNPCSDKVFFYTRKADHYINKYKADLNDFDHISKISTFSLKVELDLAVSNKASIEERGLATAEEISTFTDLPVLDSDDDFYDGEELDDEEPFLVQRTAIIRLGDFFCQSWEHRRTSIVNDIVVSAWFLSPVQSIREDVRAAMETEEYPKLVEALERYAVKMKLPLGSVNPAEYNDKKDELLATLHTELRQFQDKTGPYSRDYI